MIHHLRYPSHAMGPLAEARRRVQENLDNRPVEAEIGECLDQMIWMTPLNDARVRVRLIRWK